MAYDDYVYLGLVCASVPLGFGLRLIKRPTHSETVTWRHVYCLVVGLLLAVVGTGSQVWHCCLTVVVNYLLCKITTSRTLPAVSFSVNFGYLFFFRCMYLVGFNPPTGPTNAVQLLLTLKMVSLAFDARDACKEYELLPYMSYSFCFLGFFSGPFYTFSTFSDAITNPYLSDLNTVRFTLKELTYVPLFGVVFLVLKHYFPEEYLTSNEYLHHPWGILYRLAYYHPIIVWFRMRFYIAWQIAFAGCIAAGVGAYPKATIPRCGHGPTVAGDHAEWRVARPGVELDYTTVRQLNVWQLEIMTSVAAAFANWNMTIQFWLYQYVSKQFPWRSYRKLAVFAVAAYWHGIQLGYYVTFALMLFFVYAQKGFVNFTAPMRMPSVAPLWAIVDWYATRNMYSHLHVSFRLQTVDAMLAVWGSFYYIGLVLWTAFFVLSFCQIHRQKIH